MAGLAGAIALAACTAWGQAPQRIILPANVTPSHYDVQIVPDAAASSFEGDVSIGLDVHEATPTLVLNAVDLVFARVALSGVAAAPRVTLDATHETATLTFPAIVKPGHYVLSIAYSGKINGTSAGLFHLDYDSAAGRRRALFTQFENSDARRFMPCWDEPNRKATFTLTTTVPRNQMAVSNMPVATVRDLPGGLQRISFQESPRMSSYLLFLAVGDFERISRTVHGVQVGVVFKRGDREKARFALDAAARLLPFYEDYFDFPYPLPKLDLVAGPGSSQFFDAMENWGACFFFDRELLVDARLSSQDERLNAYIGIAHEMSHQWFGDLVTMDWWDDLWLNEGFAEWMQYKAIDHFHPEWQAWLEAQSEREAAMDRDSRLGTHPIVEPIRDVVQANEAFDVITYNKGMAVIRMLESYAGEAAFRAGIRRYIKAHAYANSVSEDLWRELDRTSAVPISPLAHQFTLQAGVPLIRVARSADGVRLTLDRFAEDASGNQPPLVQVPVAVRPLAGGPTWRGLVRKDSATDVRLPPGGLPIVDAGQQGYFRTLYAPELLAGLTAHFEQMTVADQLGLLHDVTALGLAGYEPLPDALALLRQAGPGMNPVVLRAAVSSLATLVALYRDLPGQGAYQAYARQVLAPLFARVGWTPAVGEAAEVKLLRAALLQTLSDLGDPGVIGRARELFSQYLGNADSLPADTRNTVLMIVATQADASLWEQLHTLARSASSATETQRFYLLLGAAHDPALAQRALNLALTGETDITTRPEIIRSVAGYHPDMAFDFAAAHPQQVNDWLEPDSRAEFAVRLLTRSYSPAALDKLKSYAAAHIPASATRPAEAAAARVAYTIKLRRDALPQVDRWLQSLHYSPVQ